MYAFHSTHNDLVVLWTNSIRQPFEAKAWRVTELTLLASWLHLLPGHGWALLWGFSFSDYCRNNGKSLGIIYMLFSLQFAKQCSIYLTVPL